MQYVGSPDNSIRSAKLKSLFSELAKHSAKYEFKIYDERVQGSPDLALQALRVVARSAFGGEDITKVQLNSPFDKLLDEQTTAELKDRNNQSVFITAAELQECQNTLQVIYYDARISKDTIKRIQECKADASKFKSEAEKKELARLASYYLIRGESYQYLDAEGYALEEPIKRVFYYACFPNLEQTDTLDYLEFVDADTQEIKADKEAAYKNKVKATLRLMLEMANRNKEAVDIVTPNAFFYGLSLQGRQRGKQLFIDAAIELLNEENVNEVYPNVPVVFLHSRVEDGTRTRIPVHINPGDASGPQRAAKKLELGFQVAEAIMSNPLHPVGNGALGDRAASAKEENDTRKCPTIPLVFSSGFNTQVDQKIANAIPGIDCIYNDKIFKGELRYLDSILTALRDGDNNAIAKLYDRYMRIDASDHELLQLYEDILLRYLNVPFEEASEAKEQRKGFFYRWFGSTVREDDPVHKLIKQAIDLNNDTANLVEKLQLNTNAAVMKALSKFNNNTERFSVGTYAQQVELISNDSIKIPKWMFELRNSMYNYLKKYPEASFFHSRQARATHLADFMTRQILAYSQATSEDAKQAVEQETVHHLRMHNESLKGQKGELMESIAAVISQTKSIASPQAQDNGSYLNEMSQLTVKETSYSDNTEVTPAMMDPTLKKHKDTLETILESIPIVDETSQAGFRRALQIILQRNQPLLKTYFELESLLRTLIYSGGESISDRRKNAMRYPDFSTVEVDYNRDEKPYNEALKKLTNIQILTSFPGMEAFRYEDFSICSNATDQFIKIQLYAIGSNIASVPFLDESIFKRFLVCVSPQNGFESEADQNLRIAFQAAKKLNEKTGLSFYIEADREKDGEYILKSRDVISNKPQNKPLNKIKDAYKGLTLCAESIDWKVHSDRGRHGIGMGNISNAIEHVVIPAKVLAHIVSDDRQKLAELEKGFVEQQHARGPNR